MTVKSSVRNGRYVLESVTSEVVVMTSPVDEYSITLHVTSDWYSARERWSGWPAGEVKTERTFAPEMPQRLPTYFRPYTRCARSRTPKVATETPEEKDQAGWQIVRIEPIALGIGRQSR